MMTQLIIERQQEGSCRECGVAYWHCYTVDIDGYDSDPLGVRYSGDWTEVEHHEWCGYHSLESDSLRAVETQPA